MSSQEFRRIQGKKVYDDPESLSASEVRYQERPNGGWDFIIGDGTRDLKPIDTDATKTMKKILEGSDK